MREHNPLSCCNAGALCMLCHTTSSHRSSTFYGLALGEKGDGAPAHYEIWKYCQSISQVRA